MNSTKRPDLPLRQAGVTLIEVILALTISALILSIVYCAMHLAHRSMNKGEERMEAIDSASAQCRCSLACASG